MPENTLRGLPSIDRLLRSEIAGPLIERYGRDQVADMARSVLDELRSGILGAAEVAPGPERFSLSAVTAVMASRLGKKLEPSLRHAVNATGVILHTGLGRAVLSEDARHAAAEALRGYCTLAVDIDSGRRGRREAHIDGLLRELTGAEAATVVNNNAAATMLILNTLARGKEVIVSRGQLVEIGGSFRMPDVMAASGATLREVGTTNKTHLRDYAAAIGEATGAIMRVHHSNFRILGFAEEPSIESLAGLARERRFPLIDDLGSGALVDLAAYGLEPEPLVRDSLAAGADVVCFSGDKLIGGPQSGVIAGRDEILQRIRKNPLARAFRVGKMTVAALEATLRLFLAPEKLNLRHPLYRMLSLDPKAVERRAAKAMRALRRQVAERAEFAIVAGGSQVGSGSVPAQTLPSRLLRVRPGQISAEALARKLRRGRPPVFTRIQQDAVLLDFRTVQEAEDGPVLAALAAALERDLGET